MIDATRRTELQVAFTEVSDVFEDFNDCPSKQSQICNDLTNYACRLRTVRDQNQDIRAGPIHTSSSPDDDESTACTAQHHDVSELGGLSTSLALTHHSFLPFDSNTFNNFESGYDSPNEFDFQFEEMSHNGNLGRSDQLHGFPQAVSKKRCQLEDIAIAEVTQPCKRRRAATNAEKFQRTEFVHFHSDTSAPNDRIQHDSEIQGAFIDPQNLQLDSCGSADQRMDENMGDHNTPNKSNDSNDYPTPSSPGTDHDKVQCTNNVSADTNEVQKNSSALSYPTPDSPLVDYDFTSSVGSDTSENNHALEQDRTDALPFSDNLLEDDGFANNGSSLGASGHSRKDLTYRRALDEDDEFTFSNCGLDATQEPTEPPFFPPLLEGDNRFDHYDSSLGAVGNHIGTLPFLENIEGDGDLAIGGSSPGTIAGNSNTSKTHDGSELFSSPTEMSQRPYGSKASTKRKKLTKSRPSSKDPLQLSGLFGMNDLMTQLTCKPDEVFGSLLQGGMTIPTSTQVPNKNDQSGLASTLVMCVRELYVDTIQKQIHRLVKRVKLAYYYKLYEAAVENIRQAIARNQKVEEESFMQWTGVALRQRGWVPKIRTGRGLDAAVKVRDRLVDMHLSEIQGYYPSKDEEAACRKHVKQWRDRGQLWSELIDTFGMGVVCLAPEIPESDYWSLTRRKREVLISGLIARKHEFEDLLLDANVLMAKLSSALHARRQGE